MILFVICVMKRKRFELDLHYICSIHYFKLRVLEVNILCYLLSYNGYLLQYVVGNSHMTWKERKKIEDRKVVSLGGKVRSIC
jgi:hypothetical protein